MACGFCTLFIILQKGSLAPGQAAQLCAKGLRHIHAENRLPPSPGGMAGKQRSRFPPRGVKSVFLLRLDQAKMRVPRNSGSHRRGSAPWPTRLFAERGCLSAQEAETVPDPHPGKSDPAKLPPFQTKGASPFSAPLPARRQNSVDRRTRLRKDHARLLMPGGSLPKDSAYSRSIPLSQPIRASRRG